MQWVAVGSWVLFSGVHLTDLSVYVPGVHVGSVLQQQGGDLQNAQYRNSQLVNRSYHYHKLWTGALSVDFCSTS
jgi:hypothetical protein